ncbi:MATE family efflux transporter [Intestinimonas massiliensis (ex Afouda et al. 2020)]|uniref:MATE family efflux transporter n=1 Tax=Intestinimonas massiliensis (ex Afouda et al. 2020) TaxID=1673721 RepID=UPI0034A00058
MLRLGQTGDITQGVIWKQLLAFFFPLWFGTFFQQLYNTVDTVVVGRFVGKTALAAVGSTGVIVNLTVGLFTGLAAGAVVVIAQRYGARMGDEVHKSVHTAMLLSILMGAFFMVVGFLITPWALRALNTTEDALPGAILYLQVYFLGMIPNLVYNMGTAVLRAVGDSRRPLYFLMAASLCNIVLDLLLVVVFQLGVLGVAIATVISQILSAVLVVLSLTRAEGAPFQLFPRSLTIHPQPLRAILQVGVPTALQSVMYSSSNLFIQAAINSFGTDAVAAWTAYGKMDVVFWMTITAMSQSVTTFAGQNYGAGKYDRLKKGVKVSVGMSAIITLSISAIMVLFARPILTIFTPDHDVLEIGVSMVRFLAPSYITYILIELTSGAIRGAGKSLVPTLITVFGVCGLRLLWLFTVVPVHHTIEMVEASYPITWAVTSLALLIYYRFGKWLEPPKAVL